MKSTNNPTNYPEQDGEVVAELKQYGSFKGHGPNKNRPPDERRVSWGKHEGKLFSEVPTDYLKWFARNAYHQLEARRKWTLEELNRRGVKDLRP